MKPNLLESPHSDTIESTVLFEAAVDTLHADPALEDHAVLGGLQFHGLLVRCVGLYDRLDPVLRSADSGYRRGSRYRRRGR